jgi:methyl-accepting chemotaxis protein
MRYLFKQLPVYAAVVILFFSFNSNAAEELSGVHADIYNVAVECRDNIVSLFNRYIRLGKLTKTQLFDTFYIPIPKTYPQKYHTQYDMITDKELRKILDECLMKDKHIVFAVAVDRNGYLPTHNTKYSHKLTGKASIDIKKNRTKRIFNDRTGLAAARNTKDYLLQEYNRDTGVKMYDLSVPIFIGGKHWGALRIGYKLK